MRLKFIFENLLHKTMFELPSLENIEEVIVDSGAAKGETQPILIHSKKTQSSKSKTSKSSAA